jgi:hypothetical protein
MRFSPIVRLQPANLAQLEVLLRDNNLPVQDCAAQAQNFFGIFDGDELIAAGGLEPAGDYALLRSVVVQEQYRSSGLARSISRYLRSCAGSTRNYPDPSIRIALSGYRQLHGFDLA